MRESKSEKGKLTSSTCSVEPSFSSSSKELVRGIWEVAMVVQREKVRKWGRKIEGWVVRPVRAFESKKKLVQSRLSEERVAVRR